MTTSTEAQDLHRTIRELRAENARLAAIVDKLPKTADGVPVGLDDTVWHVVPDNQYPVRCMSYRHWLIHWLGISNAYSTQEKAEAALAATEPEPQRRKGDA